MYRLYIDSLYYYIINLIILLAVDFMPWLLAAIQLWLNIIISGIQLLLLLNPSGPPTELLMPLLLYYLFFSNDEMYRFCTHL